MYKRQLESRIQNNKNNATRFIIVSAKRVCRRDADRISIYFETPHKSGALYHMLANFIYNGINMLNIQSRPISDKAWEDVYKRQASYEDSNCPGGIW